MGAVQWGSGGEWVLVPEAQGRAAWMPLCLAEVKFQRTRLNLQNLYLTWAEEGRPAGQPVPSATALARAVATGWCPLE